VKLEAVLKFPVLKTVITTWKMITNDERFWKSLVVSRLISLKYGGVKWEDFKKMSEGFGRSRKSEVAKYASKYFLKAVADALFPGIIITGVVDIFLNMPLQIFVNTLLIFTFLFGFLDTLSFVKVESISSKHRDEILSIVEKLYETEKVVRFDDLYRDIL
jgi:hypothetical protein